MTAVLLVQALVSCSDGNTVSGDGTLQTSKTAQIAAEETEKTEDTDDGKTYEPEITEVIPDMSTKYADYINYREYLVNTGKRINEDKELKVLFYGGSLTNGYGASDESKTSWRARTCSWFTTNFPDTEFSFVNRAIGESGTFLGTYRLEADVINESPDLIFLEYAINDKYFASGYKKTKMRVETIIREIKEALPKTEIVMLITTDEGCLELNKKGQLHMEGYAHEDIAKAYGVSSLHVGRLLAETCNYSPEDFRNYAVDIVHLNDAGYGIYYSCVEEFLLNSLVKANLSIVTKRDKDVPVQSDALFDGNRTHIQPTQQLLADSEALGGEGVEYVDKAYTGNTAAFGYFAVDSESDVFAFKFTGTEAAVWCNLKNADYLISVDGGEYVQKTSSEHTPAVLAEDLEPKEHIIKIKMVSGGNKFNIAAVFTRDASMATKAAKK